MKACAEWHEEILDHALGRLASAGLEAHLACCTACAAALVELRHKSHELDGAIRQLVAPEPPPYLVSRIWAQIDAAPAPVPWLRRWREAVAVLAFIAAMAALLYAARGAVETRRRTEAIAAATRLSAWRSPTEDLLRTPAEPLIRGVPRLGETFFKLEPVARDSKVERRGKDAS